MFDQYTFCGASVHSVQSNIGWNGDVSRLTVNLFEDDANGDAFSLVEGDEGTPAYFTFGSFVFNGLIEKFEKTNNTQVNPGYVVTCTDPRILLSNTKLILRNYTGVSNLVNNLINLYGYWENTGFGNSLTNDGGMPWNLIRDGIQNITGLPSIGNFGGPIRMRNFSYSVDLSELPALPNYFRIGGEDGSNLSILDFIEICCQAAGCDYFIRLSGLQIQVKVVSRTNQLAPGVLDAWINSLYGNTLVSKTVGYELRNDVNSTFLVGGKLSTLFKASGYSTFWGFDENNEAILGSGAYFKFRRTSGAYATGDNGLGWVQTDKFTLWLPQLADILGTPYYECSDFELRLILGKRNNQDYSNWLDYIKKFRPSIHSLLYSYGGFNQLDRVRLFGNPTPDAFVNDRPGPSGPVMHVQAMANAAGVMNELYNVKRVFGELKIIAETYLNKMYAVRVPNVSVTAEPETSPEVLKYSYEINNVGYIDNAGENDLNSLPPLYYGKFQNPEGLFYPFVYYHNAASGYDTELINPTTSLTYGSGLYDKCNFIEKFAIKNNTPYAIAVVNPVTNPPDSFWGADNDITVMLNADFYETVSTQPVTPSIVINPSGSDLRVIDQQKKLSFSSIGYGIAPRAFPPTNIHVPLLSNIARYGPWYAKSLSGSHTNYEQRDDFVPWLYGGYNLLNLAGSGYVTQSATDQQSLVTTNVVVADVPAYSLGDILVATGVNLTRVNIGYGTQGVQTTYAIETYVNRPGTIGKYNIDRIKRMATLARQTVNHTAKNIIKNNVLADQLAGIKSPRGYIDLMPGALQGRTPHYVLVGRIENVTSGNTLAGVCLSTIEEGLIAANINNGTEFEKGAMVSLDALLSPYSFGGTSAASGMPRQTALTGVWRDTTILNGENSHIFRNGPNNIRILTHNSGADTNYYGAHAYYNNFYSQFPVSGTPRRSMSLRAPLILTGWGRKVDTTVTWGSGDTYNPDFMTNAGTWKTGPLDMLWDENRQCWTTFGKHKGTAVSTIPAGGSGFINIKKSENRNTQTTNDLDTGMTILTWNWFNTAVSSGTKVFIDYVADDNKYYITSANC